MLYLRFTPSLASVQMLEELHHARDTLDLYLAEPTAYMGELRRHAIALSVHYSTRIEGNTLTLEQVESLLRGRQVPAPASQQREALNYYEAMQYAQSLAAAPSPRLSEDTVKAIHFIVTKSLPGDYNSGRYRTEQNFVVDRAAQRAVFRPPSPERVQPLMEEYVHWLNTSHEGLHAHHKAALAHLNFVAIHPFDDGNGRTARIIEALVLQLAGYKSHSLISLEAYFGRDTRAYYSAIAASLGPAYEPGHDVTPWTDYYLRAHAAQANAAVAAEQARNALATAFREAFGDQVSGDPALLAAVWTACRDGSIANSDYRDLAGVGNQTAARRLAQMVDAGLLVRHGRGRATHYTPTEAALRVYESAVGGTA